MDIISESLNFILDERLNENEQKLTPDMVSTLKDLTVGDSFGSSKIIYRQGTNIVAIRKKSMFMEIFVYDIYDKVVDKISLTNDELKELKKNI